MLWKRSKKPRWLLLQQWEEVKEEAGLGGVGEERRRMPMHKRRRRSRISFGVCIPWLTSVTRTCSPEGTLRKWVFCVKGGGRCGCQCYYISYLFNNQKIQSKKCKRGCEWRGRS